ncbi:MAG: Sir2 family NAD-dependent protein deacetylase, partial [Lachnospirales bacterium]
MLKIMNKNQMKFHLTLEEQIERVKEVCSMADAIVIGAGAGLSNAAGISYIGKRFDGNFKDFIDKYGMTDMYTAGFYPFKTQEEKWAYWSRHIMMNRYNAPVGEVYTDLLSLVKNKDYFVITTNVDAQFYKAGFDKDKIWAVQGDYGKIQCSKGCHNTLYDNEKLIRNMAEKQHN